MEEELPENETENEGITSSLFANTVVPARIISVEYGEAEEIMPRAMLDASIYERQKGTMVYKIVTDVGSEDYYNDKYVYKTVTVGDSQKEVKVVQPGSNLARFIELYHSFPVVGLRVFVTQSRTGMLRIYLGGNDY